MLRQSARLDRKGTTTSSRHDRVFRDAWNVPVWKSSLFRGGHQRRIAPRGLPRAEAAAYIGVSPSLFDTMVRDGRMPGPKLVNTRTLWDRFALDRAFDDLPNKDQAPEEDDWRAAL
jgi:hypothetical protein